MKYIHKAIVLGFLAMFIAFSVSAQSKQEIVDSVKVQLQAINSDTAYRIIVLHGTDFLTDPPEGGAELTGYLKGKEISKAHLTFWLPNGIETLDYYYADNKLFFVYEQFESFVDSSGALNFTKPEKTFEGRYYFHKEKLIDYVTTGHNRFENNSLDPEKTLLNESKGYLRILKKK